MLLWYYCCSFYCFRVEYSFFYFVFVLILSCPCVSISALLLFNSLSAISDVYFFITNIEITLLILVIYESSLLCLFLVNGILLMSSLSFNYRIFPYSFSLVIILSVIMLGCSCEINVMIIVLFLLWNSTSEVVLGLSVLFTFNTQSSSIFSSIVMLFLLFMLWIESIFHFQLINSLI